MERLTNSIDYCQMRCENCFFKNKSHCYENNIYNRLREYEIAEEQGLLLRLPCKIGDKVYAPCAWGIESGVVGSIEMISDRVFVNNEHGSMIGEARNIYLTKEEAEKALKRAIGWETTVCKREKCNLFYKPSLGHKCRKQV